MYRILPFVMCLTAWLPAYAQPVVVYVDTDATCSPPCGGSWANAFDELTDAVGYAKSTDADEVWVAEGHYDGPIELESGLKIIGGFAGGETAASESRPFVRRTYIHGTGEQVVFSYDDDATAVLRGFHIVEGYSTWMWTYSAGGGLYIGDSFPTIVDCVFTNNSVVYAGGGAAIYEGGTPTFTNCQFYRNNGGFAGGAVFVRSGSPEFVNCLFDDNEALSR